MGMLLGLVVLGVNSGGLKVSCDSDGMGLRGGTGKSERVRG